MFFKKGHAAAGKRKLAQLLDFDIYPTEPQASTDTM